LNLSGNRFGSPWNCTSETLRRVAAEIGQYSYAQGIILA